MHAEPTLRQLRHFLALAQHCHFGRAAEACLITQSSLSASIRELEMVLDASLFERTRRTVRLTPLGHQMVALARDVIARIDVLTDTARGAGAPLTGDLHLGVIPTIGPFLLPRVLPGLYAAWPDLRLYLHEDKTAGLLDHLAEGVLDLVVLALPYEMVQVDRQVIAADPLLAVFPRGHELAVFETMTPARLARQDMLMLEEGNCLTGHTLALGKLGPAAMAGRFQATSLHTLVQMVAGGLGVTVLPKMAVDAGILRGLKLDFRPFSSPRSNRRIALVWRKSSVRAEEFRLLGGILRDELGTPVRGG